MTTPTIETHSRCHVCRVVQVHANFRKYGSPCHTCAAKIDEEKREKARARSRQWKRDNPKKVNAYQRERYKIRKLKAQLFG